MINEERTLMDFDHTSDMLSNGSHKRVWRVCEGCGKEDDVPYYTYANGHTKCSSCALTGIQPSDETKRKMSEVRKGSKNHMYGKHHSEEAKKRYLILILVEHILKRLKKRCLNLKYMPTLIGVAKVHRIKLGVRCHSHR